MLRLPVMLTATILVMWFATPPLLRADDSAAETARLKGLEFLKSQQQEDGSWEYENHTVGITALCTLALLENGVAFSDPVVDKGYRYVRAHTEDLVDTYDVALAVLLLSRIGDRNDKRAIRTLGARLIAGQRTSGGWTYKLPKANAAILENPSKYVKPEEGGGDNSNTQFAVLGLWVASRSGIDIKDAMQLVAQRFMVSQNPDGGWGYRFVETKTEDAVGDEPDAPKNNNNVAANAPAANPAAPDAAEVIGANDDAAGGGGQPASKPEASKDSMTLAGLFCLTVARAARIRELQRRGRTDTDRGQTETLMSDETYAQGFAKAGAYAGSIRPGSSRYFLWSTERLGVLLGLPKIGATDWFAEGTDSLIKTQQDDGAWESGWGKNSDTAFAVLFLRKANLGSDISRLLNGEPEKQFQIVSRDDMPRFETIEDVLAAATAGDTIRIDGNGPYSLSHPTIDHDLTIQAGFGYEPVIEFRVGYSETGLRLRPDRDEEARHLLRLNGGTLTLEGLRIQVDPPSSAQPVEYTGLLVEQGRLRLLNCYLSEGNRRGMACIRLRGSAELMVQNSMIVGGRSAIEVEAGAEHVISIDNSVLYSGRGFHLRAGSGEPNLQISLNNSVLQAPVGFDIGVAGGSLQIESHGTIFKTDWISPNLFSSPTDTQRVRWSGEKNVFNTSRWVGARGRALPQISSARTWDAFWKDQVDSIDTSAPLEVYRRNDQFSHVLAASEWELDERSDLAGRERGIGVRSVILGPGEGFSRFRDDFRYRTWAESATAAAE